MEYVFSDKIAPLRPSAIREIFKSLSDPSIISFAAGNPSPESFPVRELAGISAEIFEKAPSAALQYSVTEGYPRLREQVAERLRTRFSVGSDSDSTIIVSGGQQGLDLTCKVLCNEGDVVICEEPSFIGALNAFRAYNTKLVGVPVEDDGMNIEALRSALEANPQAKMIYTIPTFHNPAGVTMSAEKRRAVYDLAREFDVMILEDNPYGELRFEGDDILPIKSLDTDGRVVYCGSFSKILSAGMRVGFLCGPQPVIQKVVVAKQVNDVHTNIFFQMLCSQYIDQYDLDEHIRGIRALYRRKCGIMLSEMDKRFDKRIYYSRPQGGLFLWCRLPDVPGAREIDKALLAKKVAVVPGSAFTVDQQPVPCFRMNYSMPSDEQIVTGVGIIADTINELLK